MGVVVIGEEASRVADSVLFLTVGVATYILAF